MGHGKWPQTLYDYERGAIVDEDVAELDLDGGTWVHCGRCDKTSRTTRAFRLKAWNQHKKTLTHRNAAKNVPEQSAADESPEYADFAAKMKKAMVKDTDDLLFFRGKINTRVKEHVQTKELVRRMALLVADQQEDAEVLRDEVDELKDLVKDLHEMIQDVRRENRELRGGGLHQRRRLRYETERSPLQMRSSLLQRNRDERLEVINMFEDEVQLT